MALLGHWTLTQESRYLGPELVTNGDMELDSDWANYGTPTTNEQSSEQAHVGTYSRKVVTDGNENEGIVQTISGMTVGKTYLVKAWDYISAMTVQILMWWNNQVLDNELVTGSWFKLSAITTYSAGANLYFYTLSGETATFYIDDASIREIYFEDEVGNNNGIPANEPNFITNQQIRANRATVFNGSDDSIDMGDVLDFGTDNFSIVGWFRCDDNGATTYSIISKYPDAVIWWDIQIAANTGKMSFQFDDNNVKYTFDSSSAYDDGNWHHFAIARGTTYEIYIDGVDQNAGGLINTQTLSNAGNLEIGSNIIGGFYFKGDIDNIRIYNTALTLADVTSIYNAELFWETVAINSNMDFSGAPSAQNPNWLLISDHLNWQGEWVSTISYNDRDVVLYKTSSGEYHGYVSKQGHNAGNIPTTAHLWWTRLRQGEWER